MYDDIDIRMLMVEIEIPVELGRFLPLFIRVLYIQTVGFVSLGFSDSNPFGVEQKGPVATAGCRPMFWWTSIGPKIACFDRKTRTPLVLCQKCRHISLTSSHSFLTTLASAPEG